jgi:tetratricopeptide (TPR) repeat protein
VEDLHLAVELARRAVQDSDPGDAARAGCLVNLAVYLLDRHDAGVGDGDDLAAAVDAARQAVDAARQAIDPAADDHLAAAWLAQARAAAARFEQTPDGTLLEDAIAAARAALQVASTDDDRAAGAGSLGNALLSRYVLDGDPDDLDTAISQHGRALELTASPSARTTRLNNFGMALLTRYDRSGDIGDLDTAIDVLEQASELTSENASTGGAISTNLGLVLAERYERRQAGSDLDHAVAAFRRAVERTPDRAVQRPSTLLNLGGGLIDKYERQHRRADLHDAIDRLTEGLALVSPTARDAAAFHNRLSVALRHRADLDGHAGLDRGADLDRAVDAARRAVNVTAPESPLMAGWLDGLAAALRARWEANGAERDRREASEVSRRAAEQGIRTDPATALRAALAWQSWTMSESSWDEAADATRLAVAALRTLVSTQLLRGDKETWLRDTQGLASRAALALARAGDSAAAALAADTCRGVLLDEALQSGEAGVSRLRDRGHDDLVIRLRKALARTRGELTG